MGCGGSRADAIEPRYHESWTRETESTWLTNTDSESPPQGDGAAEPAPRAGTLEDGKSTQTGVTTASAASAIPSTEKKGSAGPRSGSPAAPAAAAARAQRPSSFRAAEAGPQSMRDTKKMPTKEVTISVAKSLSQSDRRLAKNCVH